MGMVLGIGQAAVGLFGAAQNSAAYSAAAQKQREEANYNAQITRYNGEVAAQQTQYNAESEIQNLNQQKEILQRNSKNKQTSIMYDSLQRAGTSRAALAAAGAESSSAEAGIIEEEKKALLLQQEEQANNAYTSSIFDYKAGQTGQNSAKTSYNQRQQALFQGANILGSGYAKAAEYDQQAGQALTSGIFSTAINLGGMAYSGGLFGSSGPSAQAPSYAAAPPPSVGVFGPPIQSSNSYGGNFGPISAGGY